MCDQRDSDATYSNLISPDQINERKRTARTALKMRNTCELRGTELIAVLYRLNRKLLDNVNRFPREKAYAGERLGVNLKTRIR